jgi:hypothetical protein
MNAPWPIWLQVPFNTACLVLGLWCAYRLGRDYGRLPSRGWRKAAVSWAYSLAIVLVALGSILLLDWALPEPLAFVIFIGSALVVAVILGTDRYRVEHRK